MNDNFKKNMLCDRIKNNLCQIVSHFNRQNNMEQRNLKKDLIFLQNYKEQCQQQPKLLKKIIELELLLSTTVNKLNKIKMNMYEINDTVIMNEVEELCKNKGVVSINRF